MKNTSDSAEEIIFGFDKIKNVSSFDGATHVLALSLCELWICVHQLPNTFLLCRKMLGVRLQKEEHGVAAEDK